METNGKRHDEQYRVNRPSAITRWDDSTVVDVTNPAFRIDESSASLDKLRASIVASVNRPAVARADTIGPIPDLLQRMFASQAQYLDGLTTYLLKIGADNLPAQCNTEIERRLASSPNAVALRIRLQQLSRLMAKALNMLHLPCRYVSLQSEVARRSKP